MTVDEIRATWPKDRTVFDVLILGEDEHRARRLICLAFIRAQRRESVVLGYFNHQVVTVQGKPGFYAWAFVERAASRGARAPLPAAAAAQGRA